MHNFSNISCRALTVSCLSTRAATARALATSKVATAPVANSKSSNGGGHSFARHYPIVWTSKNSHAHKIYRYPIERAKFSPRMSIYQICQRTRPHSRISHIIISAFTFITKHTRAHSDMHSFSNINSRSLTVSCLTTREANTCFLDITQLYKLPKIHTHTHAQNISLPYRTC